MKPPSLFKDQIFSNAIFAQCILPVNSLKDNQQFYISEHGNTTLTITTLPPIIPPSKIKCKIPYGRKARLLLNHFINEAIKTNNPLIQMGNNINDFMIKHKINPNGSNRVQLLGQLYNLLNCEFSVSYGEASNYFEANKIRICNNLENKTQEFTWPDELLLSNIFFALVTKYNYPVKQLGFYLLLNDIRVFDIYLWLSYRSQNLQNRVKIPYQTLHNIFGQEIKELRNFKLIFKNNIKRVVQHISDLNIDIYSDKNYLILNKIVPSNLDFCPKEGNINLQNNDGYNNKLNTLPLASNDSNKFHNDGNKDNILSAPLPKNLLMGLKKLGVDSYVISQITKNYNHEAITKAISLTTAKIHSLKNPAGFFIEALKNNWQTSLERNMQPEQTDETIISVIDSEFEDKITNNIWKNARSLFYQKHGVAIFNNWIKDLEFDNLRSTKGQIVLNAKSRFYKEYINNKFFDQIFNIFKKIEPQISSLAIEHYTIS